MGSLGPIPLIALLLTVAVLAATAGFITSAVVQRNMRRTRGIFLVGFFCGVMAGAIRRARRRGNEHFASRAITFAASRVSLGSRPAPTRPRGRR